MSDYRCRRCGHPYGWRGGISFGAVCELGRLIREHYEREHPDADATADLMTAAHRPSAPAGHDTTGAGR